MSNKQDIKKAFIAGVSAGNFMATATAEPKYNSADEYYNAVHNQEDPGPEYDSAGYSEEDRIIDGQYQTPQQKPMSKFCTNSNKGFTMRFDNEMVISVQWGTGNYCERRSFSTEIMPEMKQRTVESITAEIAIWDKDGTWFSFGSDTVKGWVDANEVAKWIYLTSSAIDLQHLKNMATNWKMIA
jgi:hypothetical protein